MRALEAGEVKGAPFVAFELIDGFTVRDLIGRQRVAGARALVRLGDGTRAASAGMAGIQSLLERLKL